MPATSVGSSASLIWCRNIIKLSRLDEENVEMERKPVDLYVLCRGHLGAAAHCGGEKEHHRGLAGGRTVAVRGVGGVEENDSYNLCDNAIAYNRNGGHVKLAAEPVGRGCPGDSGG